MGDYAYDVYAEETLMYERNAEVRAIREYVDDEWNGAGTYEIEDFDGIRTYDAAWKDDLVWEIYRGWHDATIRKVG